VALPHDLVPGQAVTWVGPPLAEPDGLTMKVGERGLFVDYDGQWDQYVVTFPGGRAFCCGATDVEPDPRAPARVIRRHHAR
jgi:hypothetical protein